MDFGTSYRTGKLSEAQREEVKTQLNSYFQNNSMSMTKEQYFEMCEALGSEPLDEEIPVEFDDLPLEVQEAMRIYNNLQDSWDYMGGNYIGKNLNNFKDVLELYEVDKRDQREMYELILLLDRIRSKIIEERKPKEQKPAK